MVSQKSKTLQNQIYNFFFLIWKGISAQALIGLENDIASLSVLQVTGTGLHRLIWAAWS